MIPVDDADRVEVEGSEYRTGPVWYGVPPPADSNRIELDYSFNDLVIASDEREERLGAPLDDHKRALVREAMDVWEFVCRLRRRARHRGGRGCIARLLLARATTRWPAVRATTFSGGFGGSDNDSINGGAGNDYLFEEEDNDTLEGGSGRDTLAGRLGDDRLIASADGAIFFGQQGADVFVFRGGQNWVMDFDPLVGQLGFEGRTVREATQVGGHTRIQCSSACSSARLLARPDRAAARSASGRGCIARARTQCRARTGRSVWLRPGLPRRHVVRSGVDSARRSAEETSCASTWANRTGAPPWESPFQFRGVETESAPARRGPALLGTDEHEAKHGPVVLTHCRVPAAMEDPPAG